VANKLHKKATNISGKPEKFLLSLTVMPTSPGPKKLPLPIIFPDLDFYLNSVNLPLQNYRQWG
jgi:hypothetical protein